MFFFINGRCLPCVIDKFRKKEELIIQQHKRGDFNADYSKFRMVFHNLPFQITTIQIDNVAVQLEDLNTTETQSITIGKEFTELHLFGK